ncbi:MAG TPA: hypothetical protein VFB62_14105, partial [Polyangiaceae bacterium]|nr:hypothetical protein [Polyangiaceae bacterium]
MTGGGGSPIGCAPGEWLDEGSCLRAGIPPDGCGAGFVYDDDGGCEPILPSRTCPEGLMAVPGENQCHEVAACTRERWGGIPIEPDTQYVDANYTGGSSDGSQAAPWTSIQLGTNAAPVNAIVAVATGIYVEDVVMSKRVRL